MFAKPIIAAALGLILMSPPSAFAQEIDITAMKCADFVSGNRETTTNIMLWLSGYFTYEDDPPIISLSRIGNKENQIKQYCVDNPLLPLLEASEIFMDKKYNKDK